MSEEPELREASLPPRRYRRRWSTSEKIAIVQESFVPGTSVSQVARLHGIAPNQLFTWRRHYGEVARQRAEAGDATGLTSRYRILERQIHQLEWLLGKRTLENEMLRQALKLAEATLRRYHLPLPGNDEP